jgi:hypothetical protein
MERDTSRVCMTCDIHSRFIASPGGYAIGQTSIECFLHWRLIWDKQVSVLRKDISRSHRNGFRTQLDKLSPMRGKKRWRDDKALMKFLAEL